MAKTKAATKSPAKKKVATKRPTIVRAPEGREFVLVDGRKLADIKELADALEELADHVWAHHVNTERNDFATWVGDIFQEAELASRIRDAAGKHHAQVIIYRHILEHA